MTGENAISRFSATALPEAEREAVVREDIWQSIYRMDLVPEEQVPLEFEFNLLALPGLYYQQSFMSRACLVRDRTLAARGSGNLALVSYFDGRVRVRCGGQDVELNAGDAFLVRTDEPASFTVPSSRFVCIDVDPAALIPLLGGQTLPAFTAIPRNSALSMLFRYADEMLRGFDDFESPKLQELAIRHVHELMALAVGTGSEFDREHLSSPLRAARLREAKALIAAHLSDGGLSLTSLARRLGVTPRYIQQLFETDGTTFSRYVLEQRLVAAYRLLTNPAYRHVSITAIALQAGFNDISYFNRRFREAHGTTPSEIRNASLAGTARQ